MVRGAYAIPLKSDRVPDDRGHEAGSLPVDPYGFQGYVMAIPGVDELLDIVEDELVFQYLLPRVATSRRRILHGRDEGNRKIRVGEIPVLADIDFVMVQIPERIQRRVVRVVRRRIPGQHRQGVRRRGRLGLARRGILPTSAAGNNNTQKEQQGWKNMRGDTRYPRFTRKRILHIREKLRNQ